MLNRRLMGAVRQDWPAPPAGVDAGALPSSPDSRPGAERDAVAADGDQRPDGANGQPDLTLLEADEPGRVTSPRYVLKPDSHSSHSIMLRWLGEGRGRRLLDVGAADGLLSGKLTERGWRVTGIEGDRALAQASAGRCERMIVADLNRELPDLDGPFDGILYGDVLEHLVDPLRVLVELNRALAADGFVIISVPNIAHFYIRLLLLLGRFDYIDRGILDRTHLRFFTQRSLQAMLADAELAIERFTATPAPLYQILPASWHKRWLAATHAINALIARRFRRLAGYQFVVLARPNVCASARAGVDLTAHRPPRHG